MVPNLAFCKKYEWAAWQSYGGRLLDSDRHDASLTSTPSFGCVGQGFHFRGWDDQEHDDATQTPNNDPHGAQGQWVIGAVHHEDTFHNVDKSYEFARKKMVKRVRPLCGWPKWMRHPGARRYYKDGKWFNSGWIARINPYVEKPFCNSVLPGF